MNQFKTVTKFEYLGYIKNRSFQVITCVLLALLIIGSYVPQLVALLSGLGGDSIKEAAFATYGGYSDMLTAETLNAAVPDYNWTRITSPESGYEQLITDDTYSLILTYKGGDTYNVYLAGQQMGDLMTAEQLGGVIREIHTLELIDSSGLSDDALAAVELINNMVITPNLISIRGDFMQNYFLAYALVFVLYMTLQLYTQFIMASVVTEKSSKAMELLITSAKPWALMFGKVIGVGAAALTQLLVITGTAAALIFANYDQWRLFAPIVAAIFQGVTASPFIIFSFIMFFILGFFIFAFFAAAVGSTCSRIEDINAVGQIPILLVVAGFMIAIFGGMNAIDSTWIKVVSYIPLFTPMVMFTRQCMNAAANWEVVLSMVLTAGGVVVMGLLGAKIYRVGVMMYGKAPSLGEIVKMVRL